MIGGGNETNETIALTPRLLFHTEHSNLGKINANSKSKKKVAEKKYERRKRIRFTTVLSPQLPYPELLTTLRPLRYRHNAELPERNAKEMNQESPLQVSQRLLFF
jgi:hypothetical protein